MAQTKLQMIEKYIECRLADCKDFIEQEANDRSEIHSDDPADYLKVLYNSQFNVEDYKKIGVNDGELRVIMAIAQILGRNDIASEARQWLYE